MRYQHRAFCILSPLIGLVLASAANAQSLPAPSASVGWTWQTLASPAYGASFLYQWQDISIQLGTGNAQKATLNPTLQQLEMGFADMKSMPIDVPQDGLLVSFTRIMSMQPSDAERASMLPNDPQSRCAHAADGAMRAIFHQVIDVIDAGTGQVLAAGVDRYRIGISRAEALEEVHKSDIIRVDLSSYAGRTVQLRARVLTSYNGRGPASGVMQAPMLTGTAQENCQEPQNLK